MIEENNIQDKIFIVYNLYRILLILTLITFSYMGLGWEGEVSSFSTLMSYENCLISYLVVSLLILLLSLKIKLSLFLISVVSFCIEPLFLTALVYLAGGLASGAGVLINVSAAAASLIFPGLLSLFFAALFSMVLLLVCGLDYLYFGVNTFFYGGIHGIGIFATAITTSILAYWIKKSEKASARQQRKIDALKDINDVIVNHLPTGFLLLDEKKNIISTNDEALNGIASLNDEKKISQLQTFLKKTIDDDFLGKKNLSYQQGRIDLSIQTIKKDLETFYLVFARDLSASHEKAEQLKLAALGRLSASIAHEVRNPLQAIYQSAELLNLSADNLSTSDSRLIDIILGNCQRMNNLIKSVLNLSKKAPPDLSHAYSLHIFMDTFISRYQKEDKQTDVQYKPFSENYNICFDKEQLEQVLLILCDNSKKHSDCEKIKITFSPALDDANNVVGLLFKDNGAGIDLRHSSLLFEPFYTTSHTGVGLGLFLAKEICLANQAQLSCLDSQQGALFEITFNAFG